MNLFGRKNDSSSAAFKGGGRVEPASVPHRLTVGMARAETLAAMMAHSRASNMIEVADLLAGLYISDWERLSQYWAPENQDLVEDFLRRICGISAQRWNFLIESYHRQLNGSEKRPLLGRLLAWKKMRTSDQIPRLSASLQAVFKEAEQVAPFHDTVEGRTIPILTSECILLCIARVPDSEIGQKLASTGLDRTKLERDALFPKRAPLL